MKAILAKKQEQEAEARRSHVPPSKAVATVGDPWVFTQDFHVAGAQIFLQTDEFDARCRQQRHELRQPD